MPLLDLRQLRTAFDTRAGTVTAVDGVSLSLDRGETLALVGESGSGKSVTACSLLGLLPRRGARVTGGQAWFDGTDLLALDHKAMRAIRCHLCFEHTNPRIRPMVDYRNSLSVPLHLHTSLTVPDR